MVQQLAGQPRAQSLITAINFLDQIPRPVIGANSTRTGITFHNPGPNTVVVFPTLVLVYGGSFQPPPFGGGPNQQGFSAPLTPSTNQLGGGFALASGATLFMGPPTCQQAWQALALTAANNPLTVQEQG